MRSRPESARPPIAMPEPTPVPRITAQTTPASAPAPSVASETARQLASFSTRRTPERLLDVLVERAPVEPGRVRVLDEAGRGRDRARDADADRAVARELGLDAAHEIGGGPDAGIVVVLRRRDPAPGEGGAVLVERDRLDLGPAPVDADEHGRRAGQAASFASNAMSTSRPRPIPRMVSARCGRAASWRAESRRRAAVMRPWRPRRSSAKPIIIEFGQACGRISASRRNSR